MTIPQRFRIAKRAGFDGVELGLSENGYLHLESTNQEIEALRASAENISLELPSLALPLLHDYPLISSDPDVVAQSKLRITNGIRIAGLLGADTVQVVVGAVTQDVNYDQAYMRLGQALRELSYEAEEREISLAVRNTCCSFLQGPIEIRDFLDSIGSGFVNMYFDVGAARRFGYPEHWVPILAHRINKVAAADFCTGSGDGRGLANPLEGDVAWIDFRDALIEAGFDGVVTAEMPGYRTLPDLGIRHAGESLKRVFKAATLRKRVDKNEPLARS